MIEGCLFLFGNGGGDPLLANITAALFVVDTWFEFLLFFVNTWLEICVDPSAEAL